MCLMKVQLTPCVQEDKTTCTFNLVFPWLSLTERAMLNIYDKANSKSILAQFLISIPPENVSKPKVFGRFQGVYKWNIGIKWVKLKFFNFICDALRDLALFLQFRKNEKHLWRSVTFSKVTKIITSPWVFLNFLKLYKWYKIVQRVSIINVGLFYGRKL